ncbi:MAG: PQQ-binding-like beta-propeller repeat protein [Treponema sp.]|nr:PQQ-binding-like beta-propeller repeat protein [Treponema sp.]
MKFRFAALVLLIPLLFSSCIFFVVGGTERPVQEKKYTAEILWNREIFSWPGYNFPLASGVYYYFPADDIPGGGASVVKFNIETGKVIWESERVKGRLEYPHKIGAYIYQPNNSGLIYVFNDLNGLLAATIMLGEDEPEAINNGIRFNKYNAVSGSNFYWGNTPNGTEHPRGLMRLDSTKIDFTKDPRETQVIIPELIWSREGSMIATNILSENDILYILESRHGILAAIDAETGSIIWENSISQITREISDCSLFLYDDKILLIGTNLSCYDKYTGNMIYETPKLEEPINNYRLCVTLNNNYLYYNDNYYSSIVSLNAETGEKAWSRYIHSHYEPNTPEFYEHHYYYSFPQVYGDKLYISSNSGLRVYNAANGEFVGVDKSFNTGVIHSIIYNDILVFFSIQPGEYRIINLTAIRCK